MNTEDRKLDGAAGEHLLRDEPEIIARAKTLVREMMRQKEAAQGKVEPANHASLLGCMRAVFTVLPGLPDHLRVGVFKSAKSYPAWVQFSNADGVMSGRRGADDFESVLRGVAIKIIGVEGTRIEPSHGGNTQDFLMNNRPYFYWKNLDVMANLLQIVGQNGIFAKLGAVLETLERQTPIQNLALAEAIVRGLTNDRNDTNVIENPLTEYYWSRLPVGFGRGRAMKYGMWPQACGYVPPSTIHAYLAGHPKPTYHPQGPPRRYLREVMRNTLRREGACFNFAVQLQTNPIDMPVEDEDTRWTPDKAKYEVVAQLLIPAQDFDRPDRNAFGPHLAFGPFNGIEEHKPLGNLNRIRYELESLSQRTRGAATHEPAENEGPISLR